MKAFFTSSLLFSILLLCGCSGQGRPAEAAKDSTATSKPKAKDTSNQAPATSLNDTLPDQVWASIQDRLIQSSKMSKTQVILPGEYDSEEKCYHFRTADDFPDRLTVTGNWRYFPKSKKIISFETEEEVK